MPKRKPCVYSRECLIKRREYSREWRKRNKERVKKYNENYKASYPKERRLVLDKLWRLENNWKLREWKKEDYKKYNKKYKGWNNNWIKSKKGKEFLKRFYRNNKDKLKARAKLYSMGFSAKDGEVFQAAIQVFKNYFKLREVLNGKKQTSIK